MKEHKILVVDDNETLCDVLTEFLREEGYSVDQAYCGEDALEKIGHCDYDLVFLDIVLPGVDGIDVLRRIKELHPETDVITITSYATIETAVEALRMGAQDYLVKPLDGLDIVSEVVRGVIEKRAIIEENRRLHEELKRKADELEQSVQRLSMLNRIGQALHSILDFNDLLDFIVNAVAAQLGADRVSLMLFDKETGDLKIEASVGMDEKFTKEVRIKRGEGVAGWVVQKGEALLVENIDHDPRFQKKNDRGYCGDSFISAPITMSVPIKYQQRTLGVINVNNKCKGSMFTQADLDFVMNLAGQAAIAADNALIFRELENTRFEAITALGEALEAKDVTTGRHSDRIVEFTEAVAEMLNLDEAQKDRLRYAAVLHDIGKIGVPEAILQKPDRLTDEEYEIIKQHPRLGAELIRKISFLESVSDLVLSHHEWYDGSGYPRGLAGEDIPIESRIVAVMDAFDAMTSDRPYRKALPEERAVAELKNFTGRQFDPKVVEAFLHVLDNRKSVVTGNA